MRLDSPAARAGCGQRRERARISWRLCHVTRAMRYCWSHSRGSSARDAAGLCYLKQLTSQLYSTALMRPRPLLLRPLSSNKEPCHGIIGIRLLLDDSRSGACTGHGSVQAGKCSSLFPSRPCSFPQCTPLVLESSCYTTTYCG